MPPDVMRNVVDLVLEELPAFADISTVCKKLRDQYGLSEEVALLAIDRVPGGIIRALTGAPQNRPDPIDDPFAHMAFEKVWSEQPRLHWLSSRKKPSGKWLAWFEELRKRMQEPF
jgi:hypothetical protein